MNLMVEGWIYKAVRPMRIGDVVFKIGDEVVCTGVIRGGKKTLNRIQFGEKDFHITDVSGFKSIKRKKLKPKEG